MANQVQAFYRSNITRALKELKDPEGSSSRSIRSFIEATTSNGAEDWSNVSFLQALREMVKSEEVVYKKSKYNLPLSKSSKKSKGAVENPYKTPKTNEGEKAVKNNPYLESPKAGVKKLLKQISRVQEPVTGVTTFKKLGDEEFKLGCLKGYNFCIAGILHTSIEETEVITLPEFCNIIMTLGGKITSQVDNSTDYLVLGSLEDGRAVNESSRYIKAKKRNKIWEENGVGFPIQFVKGIDEFSGLLRLMSESERIRYESYF